jgi:hypothetical protein
LDLLHLTATKSISGEWRRLPHPSGGMLKPLLIKPGDVVPQTLSRTPADLVLSRGARFGLAGGTVEAWKERAQPPLWLEANKGGRTKVIPNLSPGSIDFGLSSLSFFRICFSLVKRCGGSFYC